MTSRSSCCRLCGIADAPQNLTLAVLASGESANVHLVCFHWRHTGRAAKLVKAARRDWGNKDRRKRKHAEVAPVAAGLEAGR